MKRVSKLYNIDWLDIQNYYDKGFGYRDIQRKFNLTSSIISSAVKNGLLMIRPKGGTLRLKHKMGLIDTTIYKTKEYRQKQSKFGGYKPKAGISKGAYRYDFFGSRIWLQSSYETCFADLLDKLLITWLRPLPIYYQLCGITKLYYPDFYLPRYGCYIDTKNDYLIKLECEKIAAIRKSCSTPLHIVTKDQISAKGIFSLLYSSDFTFSDSAFLKWLEQRNLTLDIINKVNSVSLGREKKQRKYKICNCGSKICRDSLRCKACLNKSRRLTSRFIWPSSEDLYKLIWSFSLASVAKQIGCGSSTVRKRCCLLGIRLPTSKERAKIIYG